jgi:hypothetical protein
MLKGKGRVWKASKSGGLVIYIPSDVIKDSAFPFEPLEDVEVEVEPEKKRLIIKKEEK